MDPFESFKAAQKQVWAHFAPFEVHTTPCAARLVKRAGVRAGQRVLDVACGTGVVSVTAARLGARVTGLDLTPELLERARENARIAGVEIDWHEGDVEKLPFADAAFDVVLSQFGHIFAPQAGSCDRRNAARAEARRNHRVFHLAAGAFCRTHVRAFGELHAASAAGRRAAAAVGRSKYCPASAGRRGERHSFRSRDDAVPALSPSHQRMAVEKSAGAMVRLVAVLEDSDPAKLEQFRREYDALASEYFEDNLLRQDYLITRATKI